MADHKKRGVAVSAGGNPAVARYLADLLMHAGIETASSAGNAALLIDCSGKELHLESPSGRLAVPLPVRASKLAEFVKRSLKGDKDQKLRIGPYQLLLQECLLLEENGQGIRLTEKEVAILRSLHSRNGAAISRQDLLDEVWSYAQGVETHTLETHIYRLRQKIEQDPSAPVILITTEDGYALAG